MIGPVTRLACVAKSQSKICLRRVQISWQLTRHTSSVVPRSAQLQVPPDFKIDLYASGFGDPRFLLTAPNGDIFVSESRANQIKVLRDTKGSGKPDANEIFAEKDL